MMTSAKLYPYNCEGTTAKVQLRQSTSTIKKDYSSETHEDLETKET